MHEFGRLDFDSRAGVVRLGKSKQPITAKVIGGNAQERTKRLNRSLMVKACLVSARKWLSHP